MFSSVEGARMLGFGLGFGLRLEFGWIAIVVLEYVLICLWE